MRNFLALIFTVLIFTGCTTTGNDDYASSGYGNDANGGGDRYAAAGQTDDDDVTVGRMQSGDAEEVSPAEFRQLTKYSAGHKCESSRLVAGLEQHYYFNFDRSDVGKADVKSINVEADYLLQHPSKVVRVEGNADDRGSREYNVALGMRRANSVVQMLKQAGIPERQIKIVSYGAEKPAAFGENESAWRCNRRVDLVFPKVG